MSLIDQIINLVITLDTRAPSQAGFGTPLILCYHTAWANRVREYSSPDEMLDDGFTTDDQAYKDAQILVSQSPHPSTFKIGRRDTALTQKVDITPTVTKAGFVYTGTIDGQTWTVTVQSGDAVADICDDIVVAINGLSNDVVTATDGTTKVTVTADAAGAVYSFTFGDGMNVEDVTTDTTTDDELAAIGAADPNWYGLTIADSQSKATIVLGAAWAEAQKKIFLAQTADSNCLEVGSSTDTMAALKAASYRNTATVWHRHIGGTERLATGWLGTILVPDPGGATPAFKEVSGVTVNSMSTTGMNAVLGKNGSIYVPEAGLNLTFEGKSAQGQFIDTTRGMHWLEARIKEALIQLFASSQIVPFTDAGIEAAKNAIRGVLGQGVTNGFLSEDVTPVVTAPSARGVSSINRANRRLPNVRFTAALAGAIHGLENAGGPGINGVIQV